MTHQISRRQLVTGLSAIAAGAAAGRPARKTGRAPGSVLWQAQAGRADGSLLGIVTAGGVVYASNLQLSGANLLCAFRAGTGARLWQQASGDLWQAQAAAPGTVFWSALIPGGQFGSGQQVLVASRAADGRKLWSFDTGWPNISVWYVSGMVLVRAYGTLTALDARTGRLAWDSDPPVSYTSYVATAGSSIYAYGYSGISGYGKWRLAALDAATGAEQWRFTAVTGELLSLAAGEGIICASQGPGMFAVRESDGHRLWQSGANAAVQAISGGFAITLDSASPGSGPAMLRAYRLSTGALTWHHKLAESQLMASGNKTLYTGGASQLITALAAETGETLWTSRLAAPPAAAAAAGDTLYVIDINARVYAVQA